MQYSPKYMTDQERERLWGELNPIYRLICQISYYTGLRIGEILRIKLDDISYADKTLVVRTQKNKTMNELILLPEPLWKPLFSYIFLYERDIKRKEGWVFYHKKKQAQVSMSTFQNALYKARNTAGLSENTVYKIGKDGRKFRRLTGHAHKNESIKFIYNKTKCVRSAQAQGHHKSPLSTQRYLGNPMQDTKLKESNKESWKN